MKYKYLVLDFGKVIAGPTLGHWDITPKLIELIGEDNFDREEFDRVRKEYAHILSKKVLTLNEEYHMFLDFYDGILSKMNIPNYSKKKARKIAYNRTYHYDKYRVYDNVYNELDKLKEKYTLLMLTDNWPCVLDYLKKYKLDHYFERIYVSSFYGVEKQDRVFFDYPIKEYNIKKGEALFIDDIEANLDAAVEKGFDVLLMDRENEVKTSKYKIIHDLLNL